MFLARHRRVAIFGTVVLVVVVAGFLGVTFHRFPLTTAISIGSLCVGAASLALSRFPPRPGVSESDRLSVAAAKLADELKAIWRDEAKIQGLDDPRPMPTRWRLTKLNIADHRHLAAPGRAFTERGDDINALAKSFLDLPRQRLAIIGTPGSGKTTVAIQLLRQLLETRNAADRIPVFFSLSRWDYLNYPHFEEWIPFQLNRDYPLLQAAVDGAIARDLMRSQMLLPILDGLDELHPTQRDQLFEYLNDAAAEPIILTSRREEYVSTTQEVDVLTATAVIEALPMANSDSADYLADSIPPHRSNEWRGLLQALGEKSRTPIGDVCTKPLGLWLLREVYVKGRKDPTPLINQTDFPDAATIEAHILGDLIPTVIHTRTVARRGSSPLLPRAAWKPDKVQQWLTFIASQLVNDRNLYWHSIYDFERRRVEITGALASDSLAVAWDRRRLLAEMTSAAAFALVVGVVLAAKPVLVGGFGKGFSLGLSVGVAVGLVFAVATVVAGLLASERYSDVREPAKSPAKAILSGCAESFALLFTLLIVTVGCVVASIFISIAAAAGVATGFALGTKLSANMSGTISVAIGAASGLIGGISAGTVAGYSAVAAIVWRHLNAEVNSTRDRGVDQQGPRRAAGPTAVYRHSRWTAVCILGAGGLFGASVGGLVGYYTTGLIGGALFGFFVGFLMAGVIANSRVGAVWVRVVLTCWRLALRRKLPLRLAKFLDDMHTIGLLRISGSAYQFRHLEIQEFLRGEPLKVEGRRELRKWFGLQWAASGNEVHSSEEGAADTAEA
jgi:MFS family permease